MIVFKSGVEKNKVLLVENDETRFKLQFPTPTFKRKSARKQLELGK